VLLFHEQAGVMLMLLLKKEKNYEKVAVNIAVDIIVSRLAPLSFRGLWTRLWVAIIASTPGPSCSPDIGTRRRFRGQAGS
jgi:hypothetical protein